MMQGTEALRVETWTLGRLAEEAGCVLASGHREVAVSGVSEDSRACASGHVFVAIPGSRTDGLAFARDAVGRGAVAVASEHDPGCGVPWLRVDSARRAAGRLADLVYGDPSRSLALIGVTGTNGKTTTAHLTAQLLPGQTGFIGTLGAVYPGGRETTVNTTPGPTELRRLLRRMVEAGCTACTLEVSSHALHQRRVDGLRFAVAVYTNLTGDHLDYHGSMEEYGACKARLFAMLEPDSCAVVNASDPACAALRTRARRALFRPRDVRVAPDGTRFTWRGAEVFLPLLGRHNAENAAAALEAACAAGAEPEEAVGALRGVLPARGRLEPVQREPFLVVVDYAHTDDALEKALRSVREVTGHGAVLLVFGCGGDRDRTKRPRMGAAAGRWADRIFITSDNPRSEDPEHIAREIRAGLGSRKATVLLDRRTAIGEAIAAARPGDTVLIAGKGHETSQVVGSERLPFDDAAVAREALASP